MKKYKRHCLLWRRLPRSYYSRRKNDTLKHREYIIELANYLCYRDVD